MNNLEYTSSTIMPEKLSLHGLSQQDYIQQLNIDCVIFGYQNNQLKVLIPKLKFKGEFYCLPSGFIYQHEDVDEAARRILEERTGIKNIYIEQFKVFGKSRRNNNNVFLNKMLELNPEIPNPQLNDLTQKDYEWFSQRFVSIGYYALVDINKVNSTLSELDESIEWYHIKDIPEMILDFNDMVIEALNTLRFFLDHKLTAFNLLPETFTMRDVQEVYEAVYDKPFAMNNFQKKILDLNILERLEKKFTGAANKAPYLYKLADNAKMA